jgi:mannan endo-1,4-beta-mannosidase
MALGVSVGFALCAQAWGGPVPGFVRVKDGHFERGGARYAYLGANFWYGMNLGAEGAAGDRARLVRELDRLNALGVTNLRIMAATEGPDSEPWRIAPAVQPAAGVYREDLLRGLDYLLDQMRARGMTAVVCLSNFWPWSGGMAQYLKWAGESSIPYPPPAEGGSWQTYSEYTAKFYSNERAVTTYLAFVRAVVTRVNAYSGVPYAEDPAIMSWQLANEPRGVGNTGAFNKWIERTAGFIKSLDRNHLVTTGSEGETPWPFFSGMDFVKNHSYDSIDYATAHIWAQNWGWFEPENAARTYAGAVKKMKEYFQDHLEKAARLGKPLVVEEFGLGRDLGSHDPSAPTSHRDSYYKEVFGQVLAAAQAGKPAAGVNFWAWSGEGLPLAPFGGYWKPGMPFTGDPPHETQGWYGVYAADRSTLEVIAEYARLLSN